jgi:hypothetical protein
MSSGTGISQIWSFVPLLFMGLIFGLVLMPMAKRKGRSQWLWFLAGFVPGWNFLGGLWLASLPDKSISEEVKALLNELQKFDFVPKGGQKPNMSAEPRNWKCNCGMTHEMNVPSCPECGLKRDYVLKHSSQI